MDVTPVTNAHLFLLFRPGHIKPVLDRARVAHVSGLEEPINSWGQIDSLVAVDTQTFVARRVQPRFQV